MTSPYYSDSPSPAPPAEGLLPYPWITQYDPNHQSTYYVNVETNETSWTPPDPSTITSQPPPQLERGMYDSSSASGYDNYGGGGAASYSQNSAYQNGSSNGSGGGEASSFYGSAGVTPQGPGQASYSPSQGQQQQVDENGQPADGERGLGKVIVGGGMAYMLYRMYKKNQHNKQQFKPPSSGPPPQGYGTMQGGHGYNKQPQPYQQQQQQQYYHNQAPPAPMWDQKPSQHTPYGGAPPGPYGGVGGPARDYSGSPYGQPAQSPFPPQQPYDAQNYSSNNNYQQSAPYDAGSYQQQQGLPQPQSYDQPPNYDAQNYGAQPAKSGWGDPRY